MSSPSRPPSAVLSTLFIAWCFVIGTLLMYAPWMPVWARWITGFAHPQVQELLANPTLRGAVSGFGLFHLVWGTHDLDLLIARFLRRHTQQVQDERTEMPDES